MKLFCRNSSYYTFTFTLNKNWIIHRKKMKKKNRIYGKNFTHVFMHEYSLFLAIVCLYVSTCRFCFQNSCPLNAQLPLLHIYRPLFTCQIERIINLLLETKTARMVESYGVSMVTIRKVSTPFLRLFVLLLFFSSLLVVYDVTSTKCTFESLLLCVCNNCSKLCWMNTIIASVGHIQSDSHSLLI